MGILAKTSSGRSNEFNLVFRDKDGTLREKTTNAHVFVFSRSAFRSMCDLLYERFQTGASVILYDMGEGYGKKLSNGLMKRGLNAERTLKAIEDLAYSAGWGKFRLKVQDNGDIVCDVSNSMFTLVRKETGSKSCYFLDGLLAGNASGVFRKDFRAEELECVAGGKSSCKFRIYEV